MEKEERGKTLPLQIGYGSRGNIKPLSIVQTKMSKCRPLAI